MNKTVSEALETCRLLEDELVNSSDDVEVVVCPPFTAISAVCALGLTKVKLGAQNMSNQEAGAYTGEISPVMLRDACCSYVIIGHSERRELYHETDDIVNQKARLALEHELKPIICVGETLEQRKSDLTAEIVTGQIKAAFAGLEAEQAAKVVVAYEPIWAIGTGETASAEDANAVIATIRKTLAQIYNQEVADKIRIQYGGSVKPENIKELMAQPDIDGALVGGASLNATDFSALINYNK